MSKQPDTLRIWSAVEKTDPSQTKEFNRGGGFKGTATNATYLAKRATELFGPIGIGWGVEIADEEILTGAPMLDSNGEIMAHELIHKVRVKLWYVLDGQRGEVWQFGQTTFVGKNKYGPFTDEEAPKKSLTDGMSKCLSLLGFAADIHMGRFDDNKYVSDLRREFAEKAQPVDTELAYAAVVERLRTSVDAIKAGILEGKATGDFSKAAEAWFELSHDEMRALWKAPTKGGVFTKEEREIIRAPYFREAYYGPQQQAANG